MLPLNGKEYDRTDIFLCIMNITKFSFENVEQDHIHFHLKGIKNTFLRVVCYQ